MVNKLKNISFIKLILNEIDKSFKFCSIATAIIAILSGVYVLISSKNILRSVKYYDINLDAVLTSKDSYLILFSKEIFDTFGVCFILIIFFATFILALYTFLSEWMGGTKGIYSLLSLPVARYKIFIAKFINVLSFFFVNYTILLLFMKLQGILLAKGFEDSSNAIILSNYINNELIYNDFNYVIFITIIAIAIISDAFAIALSSKVFSYIGAIISCICVFVQPFVLLMGVAFGIILFNNLTFLYMYIILATIAAFLVSIFMFKSIEV